jgi:hypothetical protein
MTNEDHICGAETTGDQPCQNPAGDNGRCWIPSHNPDATDENPAGRPSKFTDENAQAAIEAAREGLSKAGCQRAAGVGDGTIQNWLDANPTFTDEDGTEREFFRAFRRARRVGESELVQGGLYDDDTDSSMAKFLLASSFDYKKTEQREVTGEDGGPVEIEISETVVETPHSTED